MENSMLEDTERTKTWVVEKEISNHAPIFLQMKKLDENPLDAFNFNSYFYKDIEFIKVVNKEWSKYDHGRQFNSMFSLLIT